MPNTKIPEYCRSIIISSEGKCIVCDEEAGPDFSMLARDWMDGIVGKPLFGLIIFYKKDFKISELNIVSGF